MKYAGIGSRETPDHILEQMQTMAETLSELGYILRTGGAAGADANFEVGAMGRVEVYLPWPGYNREVITRNYPPAMTEPTADAIYMAGRYHPAWERCTQGARKLHGRNCHIILGPTLDDPVDFVLCWTKNGQAAGGTGLGIRLALGNQIPVFNLFDDGAGGRLFEWITA